MSRKIKFRAWDKAEKKYRRIVSLNYEDYKLESVTVYNPNDFAPTILPLDRVVLEQYIDLEDRNGREICEGDIVEDTLDGLKYGVRWIKYEARLIGVRKRLPHWYPNDTSWVHIEVIGNIHENPELLDNSIHGPYGPIGEENIGGESRRMQK